MRHRHCAMLVAAALVLLPSWGRAQDGDMMTGMMEMMQPAMLLQTREIQKELKLRPEQVKRIQERQRGLAGDPKSRSADRMGEEMQSMATLSKDLEAILDPPQVTRFHQLLYQYRGGPAIADPDVEAQLGLTETQKGQVGQAMAKLAADRSAVMESMQQHHSPGAMKDVPKKLAAARKTAADTIVGVLTPEQAEKWKAMQGAPFKFPKSVTQMQM